MLQVIANVLSIISINFLVISAGFACIGICQAKMAYKRASDRLKD